MFPLGRSATLSPLATAAAVKCIMASPDQYCEQ